MKLVYKNNPGHEVRVGDTVQIETNGGTEFGKVHYFRPPHKPASEGLVTVLMNDQTREYYVSVIGAEWIEREDRLEDARVFPGPDLPPDRCAACQLPSANTLIEGTLTAHVRVVGPESQRVKAIDTLYAQGWRVTRSGPLVTDGYRVSSTRYELVAERPVDGAVNQWTDVLSSVLQEKA